MAKEILTDPLRNAYRELTASGHNRGKVGEEVTRSHERAERVLWRRHRRVCVESSRPNDQSLGEQRVEKNKEAPSPAKGITQFMLEHANKWGVKGLRRSR